MNVKDIMTRSVEHCAPDDTLDAAARLMWENDCGCVPVVDGAGRVMAMLTDRDVCMAAYTQGRALDEMRVESAMSASLQSVGPQDSISKAERIMQEHQVHRLPVVDDDERLVGIVSLNDIAREAVTERRHRQRSVTLDDVAVTMAAVCRPRVRTFAAVPLGFAQGAPASRLLTESA